MSDHTSAPTPGHEAEQRWPARQEGPRHLAFLNALPGHVALIDRDGVVLAANESWRHGTSLNPLLGHEVAIGDNYLERLDRATGPGAVDAPAAAAGIRQLLRGEVDEFALEYPCHPTPAERWFNLTVTPVRDDPLAGALVMHVDTTARKQQELLMQRSQLLARTAGRLLGIGPWAIDAKRRKLTWSPTVCSMHEWPADYVPDFEYALHYYAPEFRAGVAAALAACFEHGTTFDVEVQILTAQGRRVWVRSIAEAARNGAGEIDHVQGAFQDISTRKQAEARAQEVGERLTTTLETLTDGFFTVDRSWRFTYINSAAERLLLRPRAEILGTDLWVAFPGVVGTVFQQEYERAVRERVPVQFEAFYAPLGIWVDVRALPSLHGLAVYFRDIGAVRQATEALRTSEERFRLLARATNDGIWDWDLVTDTLWWNDGYTTTFGYEVQDLDPTLKSWTEHIHPDDLNRVVDGIHHVIDHGGDTWTDDYRFRCRDGSDAYVLDRGYVIRDGSGKAIRMIGGMTDLTARKRAEEALRASTEEFRILAEAMPQMVWTALPDGSYVYVNAHWMEYTGLTLTESLGDGWDRPLHPDDQRRTREAWRHATATTSAYSLECRLRRADGAYRWWLIRAVPQRDPAGAVLKWFGTCTDIHDLKLAEVEISRANLALQGEIEERTRAEAAAETANRTKGEFLANMSHEIRTPLNGVIGMTQLALDTDLSREQRGYLDLVKSSSESLLTVINDILDFSKIEAGRLTVDVVPFDLRDCVETTLRQLAVQAHIKGMELVHDLAPDVPTALLGDPGRLRQIITNLIGNAVKFTDAGEVVLTVAVEARADGHAVLLFKVTDTGIGIPADQRDAIFKPFIQVDGSSTRKYGGTGLGLAISKNLVELFGGRIWLGSNAAGGSVFSFTIPFELQPAPSPAPARPVGIEHLRNMPVLVVDDNATNRHTLEAALERWQMRPVLADGGRAAIAAMQAGRSSGRAFPLVLIDAQMPDLDGFAVADAIKKDPALAGATILMLTSAGLRGDAARCRELGISAYLVKPISQPELLEAILMVHGVPPVDRADRPVVTRHSLRESRRQLRVLLAEDNKVNQLVASRVLEKRGHSVVIAGTGREAIAALDGPGLAFDLILMDVQMPDMDGFEATAIIREREKLSGGHLPIVAMTAHAMKGDEERCLAAGMDGYVSKPIQTVQLFETIARIVAATETSDHTAG
jgi:PAS domain S-box-containing protein